MRQYTAHKENRYQKKDRRNTTICEGEMQGIRKTTETKLLPLIFYDRIKNIVDTFKKY